jgi:ABC-type glutathione transport system ATPase component
VRGLSVEYRTEAGRSVRAVQEVSLCIQPGEALALVGESGSGKTSTAMSVARLLPSDAVARGSIELGSVDVTSLRGGALRRWWTRDVGVVVQDPARALNPTMKVGNQVAERYCALGVSRSEARRQAMNQLARVGPTSRRSSVATRTDCPAGSSNGCSSPSPSVHPRRC